MSNFREMRRDNKYAVSRKNQGFFGLIGQRIGQRGGAVLPIDMGFWRGGVKRQGNLVYFGNGNTEEYTVRPQQ